MQRRLVLAIVLMMVVALLPQLLWPPKKQAVRRAAGPVARDTAPVPTQPRPVERPAGPPARSAGPVDTVMVETPLSRYAFSTAGGSLILAELKTYHSTAPADSSRPVQLVPRDAPMLGLRIVLGQDTLPLSALALTPSSRRATLDSGAAEVTWIGSRARLGVSMTHTFRGDRYVYDVRGRVTGLGLAGAVLLVDLGQGLRSVERDSVGDVNSFAVVTKAEKTRTVSFGSLDPAEADTLSGPFEWAAFKSKYFLVAALAIEPGAPRFGGALLTGGRRDGKVARRTAVTLTLPVLPDGVFRYQVYAGPLENRLLAAVGHDLDDANPYGWIFRPIVRPVSEVVTRLLVWMHERLNLAYGWVLIFFGFLVRVVLWPLNQKAMESGIKMQAIQPELKALQDRYKNEPQKLQQEMLRLYREHGVNPVGGCLPMLLPMPVLIALFFVFANTIEFRGVPFFWLPDLSLYDPYYAMPLLMGVSMYGLQRIGMIGVPPNPQTKMMLYFMPIFMTVVLFRFSSGLNLYYTAQNLFSLPQQFLIARRRLRGLTAKPRPKR